jgi:hypothetical protein
MLKPSLYSTRWRVTRKQDWQNAQSKPTLGSAFAGLWLASLANLGRAIDQAPINWPSC